MLPEKPLPELPYSANANANHAMIVIAPSTTFCTTSHSVLKTTRCLSGCGGAGPAGQTQTDIIRYQPRRHRAER